MLKVNDVTKYYGSFLAVDNLSFEVKEGEVFGLLGINGAGKTTTFRMIMGLLEPTEGNISLYDKKIDYSVTDDIGFLTEERSLLTKLTVKEQALYYGHLKSMKEDKIISRLKDLLKEFEIPEYFERKIKELSKGNQQKIQFIMAILNNPKLLILDEPFTGLDPINIELFKKQIKFLKDNGAIIIFSSHRMEHVELFCEKLVVLVRGNTVLNGYLDKIKKDYRKKTIFVNGDVEKKELLKISGVEAVKKQNNQYEIIIDDASKVENVFKYIKGCKNIIKFSVEEPSLNDIFIAKVGEYYDK